MVDLSLSDSDPSMSSPSLHSLSAAPPQRQPPRRGSPPGDHASASLEAFAGADAPEARLSQPVRGLGGEPREHFVWLHALTRDQRRRLRRCPSPRAARAEMAAALQAQSACVPLPPAHLAEELRRHTQAAQRRALDLEEAIARHVAAHEAELAHLAHEHRRTCRRATHTCVCIYIYIYICMYMFHMYNMYYIHTTIHMRIYLYM